MIISAGKFISDYVIFSIAVCNTKGYSLVSCNMYVFVSNCKVYNASYGTSELSSINFPMLETQHMFCMDRQCKN